MKLTRHTASQLIAAAITCIAIVMPAAALASAGSAAAAGSPAPATSPAHPVTAYIVNSGSGTVIPINTATSTAGKAVKVGHQPTAIAITPNGKTAYVTNGGSNTVTPINTATNKAGKAIKVGVNPGAIAITPDGKTAYVVNEGWAGTNNRGNSHADQYHLRQAWQGNQGRPHPMRHRDHAGRKDGLRRQQELRHRYGICQPR